MKKLILITPVIALFLCLSFSAKCQALQRETAYQIKCKGTGKVIDIRNGSDKPGTSLLQKTADSSLSQKFTFIKVADSIYNIITNNNLFISLKQQILTSEGGNTPVASGPGSYPFILIQDQIYNTPTKPVVSIGTPRPALQQWKLIPVDSDGFTYLIQSTALPDMVLAPVDNRNGSALKLVKHNNGAKQKWIISDPEDMINAPLATPSEINHFTKINDHQMGVAVLGGETSKPFFYHDGNKVYRYKKILNEDNMPGYLAEIVREKSRILGAITEKITDVAGLGVDIYNGIKGLWSDDKTPNLWYYDVWLPSSPLRKTVCGKMHEDAYICPQDYLHTKVTVDKDVNLYITPSPAFSAFSNNQNLASPVTNIEGEVKIYSPNDGLIPSNPLLMQIKKDDNVCMYGPWMGDILDFSETIPGHYRDNNEIHPLNQIWYKKNNETTLIATVDETGYFDKKNNKEIEASGLNQKMRFYVAFEIPSSILNAATTENDCLEYQINGVAFKFSDTEVMDIDEKVISLKYKGKEKLKIRDNSFVRLQKTHKIFFDMIKQRANGDIQGYIVVETEKITKPGGSINLFVKKTR